MKTVPLRRRQQQKTNYRKRLTLLKSGQPRLVVRKSNANISVQLVQYVPAGDKVLFTLSSKTLEKHGWNYSKKNTSAAYLIGLLAGKKALELKIKNALFDMGLLSPKKHFKYYAVLKGAVDAGLNIPHGEDIFPSEDRIKGAHVEAYYASNANKFTAYAKNKVSAKMTETFEKVKSSIENGN